jgi:hypothetical protein
LRFASVGMTNLRAASFYQVLLLIGQKKETPELARPTPAKLFAVCIT